MQHYQILYEKPLPWISRYNHQKVSVSRAEFHYFTSDQEGFVKVNLSVEEARTASCEIGMYYQQANHFEQLRITTHRQDQSPLADFSLMEESVMAPTTLRMNKSTGQSLWVEKHSPNSYNNLLTDEYLNRTVLQWVKEWDELVFKKKRPAVGKPVKSFPMFQGKPSTNQPADAQDDDSKVNVHQLLLLAGPPGCGKTTLARVVARHCGYNYIEINASDNRSAKTLISRLEQMTNNESVTSNGKPTLIILDEVDGVVESESNGIKEVLHYMETGEIPGQTRRNRQPPKHHYKGKALSLYIKRPVLFICNDPYTKGLKELRAKARVLNFGRIKTDRLFDALRRICLSEKMVLGNEDLLKVCELNQNDIRGSLSMLEFIGRNVREGVSAKDSMRRIVWQKKESVKTLNEFLEDILCRKDKTRSMDYRRILDNLYSIDATNGLLLEGFFMNYRNSKSIYRNSSQLPKLLDWICDSDRIINNAFEYNYEMNCFLAMPYAFFRVNFRNEDSSKIEYPYVFFERLNKQKAMKNILDKFMSVVSPNTRVFMTRHAALLEYVPALLACMPPATTQEADLIKSIKLMVNYGIEFGDSVQNAYNPSLHLFFQNLQAKLPASTVSNATRLTMSSHYKQVKENMMFESEGVTTTIRNELKKDKGRRTIDGIQYRFLQGTGTEIQYSLSLKYFA